MNILSGHEPEVILYISFQKQLNYLPKSFILHKPLIPGHMHRKVTHLALYLQHVWSKSIGVKEKLKHIGLLLIIALANGLSLSCILFGFVVEASEQPLATNHFLCTFLFFYTLHLQVALVKSVS